MPAQAEGMSQLPRALSEYGLPARQIEYRLPPVSGAQRGRPRGLLALLPRVGSAGRERGG